MKLMYQPLQQLADYVYTNYGDFDEWCEVFGQPVDAASCATCNRQSYFGGRPAYECANFKRVYLWRHLVAHVVQTEQPFKKCAAASVATRPNIRALSVGGGPGTEAIALMDVLRTRTGTYSIVFDNFEAEASWQPFYDDLVNRFAGYLKRISIDARFSPTGFVASRPVNSTAAYDVVFVSWLLSESDRTGARKGLLEQMQQATRPDGYLIVTDRTEDALIDEIDTLLSKLEECSVVDSDRNCHRHAGIAFPDEWKETFKPILTYRTAYWVLRRSQPGRKSPPNRP